MEQEKRPEVLRFKTKKTKILTFKTRIKDPETDSKNKTQRFKTKGRYGSF